MKRPLTKRQLRRIRGQAMVEYTLVSHALLIGGTAASWPFLSYFMTALSKYYASIFFILSSSVP